MPKSANTTDMQSKYLYQLFITNLILAFNGTIFNTPLSRSRASEVINETHVYRGMWSRFAVTCGLIRRVWRFFKQGSIHSYLCLNTSCRILVTVIAMPFGLRCLSSRRVPFYVTGMKAPRCISSTESNSMTATIASELAQVIIPLQWRPKRNTDYQAFSVNYFIPEADMTLQDPDSTLKIFEDSKTASGNTIQVCWSCCPTHSAIDIDELLATLLLNLWKVGICSRVIRDWDWWILVLYSLRHLRHLGRCFWRLLCLIVSRLRLMRSLGIEDCSFRW